MKKIVQFLFVSVMILFVGLPAMAQDKPDAGNFYIKTADGKAYLGPSNDWGTRASLVPHSVLWTLAKISDGVYTLESRVSNGGTSYFFNGGWCDGGAQNIYFTEAGDGAYYLSTEADANYFKQGDNGACNLPRVDFTAKKDESIKFKLVKCIADGNGVLADGEDVTYMIKCADFGRNNRDRSAWIVSADCTNKNLDGGTNENKCAESWHSTFTINQVLNVPNGYYKLSAQAFYRQDGEDNDNLPVLYGNDVTATFPLRTGTENSMNDASNSFNAGNYAFSTDIITVTDNELEVGVKNLVNGTLWCIWDNISLVYVEALDAPVRREFLKATAAGDEKWTPANTYINKKNAEFPDYVTGYEYKSSVVNGIITVADAIYKANQLLVGAKDMIDAKYAEGEGKLFAAKDEIQKMIDDANALIDEALAQADIAYAAAKDAAEVGKLLPAGGYYLQKVLLGGKEYLGYAGGDRGSKIANAAHPVEWTFVAVNKYGVYNFESAVANEDKFYLANDNGLIADGEKQDITISKAPGFDAKNPTFVLAVDKKYVKADYSLSSNIADAAVWTIKSTAPKAIPATTQKADKSGYDDPIDVTYLIKDANFDSNRFQSAWTFTVDKGDGGNDGNLRGGKTTNFCAESYKAAFVLSQELTGIPNGYYTFFAQGASNEDTNKSASKLMFVANDEKFYFAKRGSEDNLDKMSDSFAELDGGKPKNYVGKVEVYVTDGKLTLGAINADKTMWVTFDNFALYYHSTDSSAYNAQVGDSVLAEWTRLDAKYNKLATAGDNQFDSDKKGNKGAIRNQIDLIKDNTTTKEVTIKKKEGDKLVDVKIVVPTGFGIDQLAASTNPERSFVAKPVSGGDTEADSLYAKMAGVNKLLDNYKENAAARDELFEEIAKVKTLWQAVYDLGNVRYGDVAKNYDGEYQNIVAAFRGQFEENLVDLNAIDLAIDAIAEKVGDYFFAGTVVNKKDEIKNALAEQKTAIEDELVEIQEESKMAVDNAAEQKIALYDAAIVVINQHYKDKHEAIAKEANDKLFTIHEQIVAIQAKAAQEYEKDVVEVNGAKLAKNELPTAAFGYDVYLTDLENVETAKIEQYLADADAAALAENNALVNEYKNGFYKDGKLISDGYAQLVKRFADAQGKLVADIDLDAMKENKDNQYYHMIQEIATDLVTLRDTLEWYATEAHTKVIPGGVDQVHATFAAPANTNTTWDGATKTFTWSTTWYNQLRNIGLPAGDVTGYKKLVVDCNITEGDRFRILIYQNDANRTLYAYNGRNEYDFSTLTADANGNPLADFLKDCTEICLSGNNAAAPGTAIINDVYLETYPDPATTKDTIICIFDSTDFLDRLISTNQEAIYVLAEIIENSDAKKALLADELSELRATWNQAKVGLIEVDPEVAAEDGLQKSYDAINSIDLELTAPDYYYDDDMYNARHAWIESEKLRLSDYDEWVETYTLDGDLNVDGEVTITDVLLGIQYNLGNAAPQSKQEKYAAYTDDWKSEKAKVDAIRVIEILNIALGEDEEEEDDAAGAKARVKAEDLGADYLVKDGAAMNLVNATTFVAFEMDVTVADGSELEATLGERASKLKLYTKALGNGKYHLLAMSLTKAPILDNDGRLLNLNNENVLFSDIQFVDGKAKGYVLDVINASDIETESETEAGEADAIASIKAEIEAGAEIYTVGGAKLNKLQKGVNIIKKADGSVRKVLVK